MTTVILTINDQTSKGKNFKKFLEDYVRDNTFVTMENLPNDKTRDAIDQARNGDVLLAGSAKELFDSV